ncbi:hypothetical protein DFH07DRAFT_764354 [Mycena maculata]|uniref:CCHC-type domain-containing protein n=1 Tax=Mycena maculata TaxID=230809 RepID=A0AAD7KFA4_9AGAR|nr:hypothetical protein DFH07DRAFT_764354 [Mycena maculata]
MTDISKVEFPYPFYGDDRDADNGFLHIRELQKNGIIYDDAVHAKLIRIWALTLEGEAKAWWNEAAVWAGKNKAEIDVVVTEFEMKWPAPSASPKKQHEKMAEFTAVTLSDEEVGRKFIDNQGAEFAFVKELMKKAYSAGDSSTKNLMLPQAIARIPPRLAKAIGDSCVDIQTWDELLVKTEAVWRAKIDLVVAEEKKQKELKMSLESRGQSSGAHARHYHAGHLRSRVGSLSPSILPGHPRPTAPAPATFSDPLADIAPLTSKTIKLSHENTVQGWKEYTQATRNWEEKWGANMLPTAARPCPLQPGGSELGGAGCWTCGLDGHFGRECTAVAADRVPPKEAYWRQASQTQGRSPAPLRSPIALRSGAHPNSPIPAFNLPPRTPHTLSPAYRHQPPPHFNQTNAHTGADDGVLMVVDSLGNYHGDVDPQVYTQGAEWEEVYGYYPGDYYLGNGNGSNGF